MRRRQVLSVLSLSAAVFGCGASASSGGIVPGIQINVTFAGVADCQAAGVSDVTINVAGNSLPPQQDACGPSGAAISYTNVRAGTYTATVKALDGSGKVIYAGIGDVNVELGGPSIFMMNLPAATP